MLRALVFFACLSLSACNIGTPITVEEVIERHTAARGGAERLEALESMEVELNIVEPNFTVTGHYRASRRGYMRIDVFAGERRVFTEALGPDGGWQMFEDGTIADLSEEGAKALIRGVAGNLYAVHERATLGYAYEFVGMIDQDGDRSYQVQEVAPDGFSRQLFFDAQSFLITRDVETSALHPDVDATEQRQETYHSNFEQIDGMIFASVSENFDLASGERLQQTSVTKRTLNAVVDPAIFRRPER